MILQHQDQLIFAEHSLPQLTMQSRQTTSSRTFATSRPAAGVFQVYTSQYTKQSAQHLALQPHMLFVVHETFWLPRTQTRRGSGLTMRPKSCSRALAVGSFAQPVRVFCSIASSPSKFSQQGQALAMTGILCCSLEGDPLGIGRTKEHACSISSCADVSAVLCAGGGVSQAAQVPASRMC